MWKRRFLRKLRRTVVDTCSKEQNKVAVITPIYHSPLIFKCLKLAKESVMEVPIQII